ncbi:ATP-dependent RNA helicase mtr4 [Hondaea fermentalgiana]|uniref:ATP-dependent RNA helicase mtr4 n=1 Tax=Hondaea fermentalgiana TaxID=2315210 RepID=A0A2R5GNU5_9STRA|nr:ATP-dependent RNA helicase mtr4 [Hondaea fermentalgiana]|eukprot:GBG32566.1 ATP-dependent RNA helicase mtr4 [Hondaea fermentalgiana]
MMARPVRTGPRLTKKARERKHEAEKADKALGGATMKEVEGEEATKKTPHWYVELQWFRLLRGQARLNQIARLLVELAPNKVFDPRGIYAAHLKEEANNAIADEEDNAEGASGKGAKKNKKAKKPSKADLIRQQNTLKRQKDAAAKDAEKLRTLGAQAGANIKLKTESGKLLLLLGMLKQAVRDNLVVDVLDTMWEIEEVSKEVDEKERKAAFKPYGDVIKQAAEIRNSREALGGMNIFDFQLTAMSDRLPPLNLHSLSGKFKLDQWQLHVIDLINKRKSVLITAPTSSGKTVLSTFVCTTGLKVLFTVPSEPLAWQVAAMLRALKVDVAILVPTLSYVPLKWTVVVGTPHSLESGLTKQVGFDFDYMVGDEIHSLNNQDGPALQRLIRAIPKTCKVLALSATIGNATELQNWWETIVGEGEIELVVHKSRFINLQRYVWANQNEMGESAAAVEDNDEASTSKVGGENVTDGKLQPLHPCSVLSVDYLASEEYASSDLAFTPVDAYALFKAMDALAQGAFDVSDLKPKTFFAPKGSQRVTLMQAKEYEDALKERLVKIAKEEPDLCALLLASLAPGNNIKTIKKARKPMLSKSKEELAKFDRETAEKLMGKVEKALESSAVNTSNSALADLTFDLHRSERTPAICFQLDSVRCQSMFDGMLRELEERELRTHPNFRRDLERKSKGLEKLREKAAKRAGKRGDDDDAIAEAQEFGESGVNEAVDVNTPHPDFVLTPPGRGMSAVETRDVEDKLRDDLPPSGDLPHPLIRGLRRGIGMYIEGLSSGYQRLVQAMAQQGRLGIVFSDELLAYGVNMPFRSAVFFGDPGPEWLTPLLHQQMAGRAGRRGLDRQGNLIYCGFAPSRLKNLLRGRLPRVTGRWPLYPTIPLQLEMNKRYEVAGAPLTTEKMQDICATPLEEWLDNKNVEDYYGVAENWIKQLGILDHPPSSYNYLIPELVWELRKFLPESLALEYLLEPMVKKYRDLVYNQFDKDADVAHQTSMFLLFCRICSREPHHEFSEAELESAAGSADALKWARPLPFPHSQDDEWDRWTEILNESQQRILDSDLPYKEQMLLPVPMDAPLDNMVYASFVRNQIDPALPTPVQHHLRERIWNVGEILRITSNVLGRSPELQPVQNLIRKAFVRIRYILDECATRNWKKFDDASVSHAEAQAPVPPAN